MTTSAADHAKALRLMQELGATLDQANEGCPEANAGLSMPNPFEVDR